MGRSCVGKRAAAIGVVLLWGMAQVGGCVEGAPALGPVTDAGNATAHLTWSNSADAPSQFLGCAYDLYTADWVSGFWQGTPWQPFPANATSGNMGMGFSGGYFVWIGNQYANGHWYPCGNPWAGILHSGTPHTPSGAGTLAAGPANVRLHWAPDIYGTWCYPIIVYRWNGANWIAVSVDGPGGNALWHYVDYGGACYAAGKASFLEGWADFSLPSGAYCFYIWGKGWQAPSYPMGDCAMASVIVPSTEQTFTLPGGVPLVLRRISPGSFQMGSPDDERSRFPSEGPLHTVNIGYTYYLGKFEVTQGQWQAVMGSNPAHDCGTGDNYPVYYVRWNDCQAFISSLNGLGLGGTFRLPSEAEWERSCRGGTQTRFFYGNSLSVNDYDQDGPTGMLPGNRSDYMWWTFNMSENTNGQNGQGAHPVGAKQPNQFGLFDMSGNVGEWCQDWFHTSYTGAPANGNAWESQQPGYPYRVNRGGGWSYKAFVCRAAHRGDGYPDSPYNFIGLRLAWTPN